jgi:mitochondrial fission protein ELM1
VVLMKPSLPCAWFDLCLVPDHDAAAPAANLLTTRGVLNDIRPATGHDSDTGLIVIGGPSRHVRWNTGVVLAQVEQLQRQRPKRRWWLITSRRTPEALVARLGESAGRISPVAGTAPDGLPARLAQAGEVWVTRDSVSMIYEALSAGARVGLLDVPPRGRNRVTAAVDRLIDAGWVTAPGHWRTLAPGPGTPLNEAARCADWMVREWLTQN